MLGCSPETWTAVLGAQRVAEAWPVALDVAIRLTNPAHVRDALAAALRQTAFPESMRWEPFALAQGDAGLALLCSYLDACQPGEGWDDAGHALLEAAVRGAERRGALPAGSFGGLAGLAFAAWSLSRGGTRYTRLLAALEEVLVAQAVDQADELTGQHHGVAVGQFDVISGLSGIGSYLLCRRDQPRVADALDAVLRGLVALTTPGEGVPGWHTPARLIGDDAMARHHPYGNLNCGLAHGIPGPLAMMALAYRDGARIPGLAQAIGRVADWLMRSRADDAWGINWPSAIPLTADGSVSKTVEPTRSAWCYGSPGIARALWLAGQALGDSTFGALAVEAMEAVFRRPLPDRGIDSPTFCHGVAGLLQITLRFAHETGLAAFAEAADVLARQLLDLFDLDRLLGYYSLEPGGNRVDQPGLLDGAAGVALVLLAAATDKAPSWDRVFLIA